MKFHRCALPLLCLAVAACTSDAPAAPSSSSDGSNSIEFVSSTSAVVEESPTHSSDERVTKKPFGIFITPENSPVSPEKFRGYHSGTDFEAFDSEQDSDLNIIAICDGIVRYKNYVNGYGGVIIQDCTINNEAVTVLYGHLSLASITSNVGDELHTGDHIGALGKGYSPETDGERKHLHLSIHRGAKIELKGYVQSEKDLDQWIDPMSVLTKAPF